MSEASDANANDSQHLARVERENRLLLQLLDLGGVPDVAAFLDEALAVAVGTSRASRGYLAVLDGSDDLIPTWSVSKGWSDEEVVDLEASFSAGIVAEALRSGEVIHTHSALLDPRFDKRRSVRDLRIGAVLCTAIGDRGRGVLYLQASAQGDFDDDDIRLTRVFARHLAPLLEMLLISQANADDDPTVPWRRGGRFQGLIGRSHALAAVLQRATSFARLDQPILITGPTGSGKTALAREIHAMSERRLAPYVEHNCAAIPESLFETELFGASRNAFTGLDGDKTGLVETAEGGTLMLDEIAKLTPALQAKLLRFVQDKEYYRVGDPTPRRADVRIIAATNVDLHAAVYKHRTFREDLFHRLAVLPLHVPALDERPEDVPHLIDHIGRRVADDVGMRWPGITPGARMAARTRTWPGNIRELANHVQRGLVTHGDERPLTEAALLDDPTGSQDDGAVTLDAATEAFQRQFIAEAIDGCGGNRSEAARTLGIARSTLYALIDQLGIQLPDR